LLSFIVFTEHETHNASSENAALEPVIKWDGIDPRDPGITLRGQGQSKPNYQWYSLHGSPKWRPSPKASGSHLSSISAPKKPSETQSSQNTPSPIFFEQVPYAKQFMLWKIIEKIIETHTWIKSDWPQNIVVRIPTFWRYNLLMQWVTDLAKPQPLVLKRKEPCVNVAARKPGILFAWMDTWFPFFACSMKIVDIRPTGQNPAIPKFISVAINDIRPRRRMDRGGCDSGIDIFG
jgi:hypothetical protein